MAILLPCPSAARTAVRRARLWTVMVPLVGLALFATTCGKSGADVAKLCPGTASNPGRSLVSAAMTKQEFCDLYIQTCTGANSPRGGYTTTAECEPAYSGLMLESTRQCRSYHLCNSAAYDSANTLLHCGHAVGIELCPDTAP